MTLEIKALGNVDWLDMFSAFEFAQHEQDDIAFPLSFYKTAKNLQSEKSICTIPGCTRPAIRAGACFVHFDNVLAH